MPTYDYYCDVCQSGFSLFFSFSDYDNAHPICPNCRSEKVKRRIGRVSTSENDRVKLERLRKETANDNSSQALGRVMRSVSEQSGVSLKPEYKEVISRLERGESRASIDRDYN